MRVSDFPMEVLRQDVYMEDVLSEAAILEETLEIQQLNKFCNASGFLLRKWAANDPLLDFRTVILHIQILVHDECLRVIQHSDCSDIPTQIVLDSSTK